jgi:hypothetical protein
MKGAQLESESTCVACSQSLWSVSPTANHVMTLPEHVLARSVQRTHDCSPRQTALASWEVHHVGDNDCSSETNRQPADKTSPMPLFMRIREVIFLEEGGFLSCDCGEQQPVGLVCVHTMTVMESLFPGWRGPTHHDVSPHWWVAWVELAHKPHNQAITSALLALMDNEVPGPGVPGPMPLEPPGSHSPVTPAKSVCDRVKNHSRKQLAQLVPSPQVIQEGNAQRTITTSEGLTQESYIVQPLCDHSLDHLDVADEDCFLDVDDKDDKDDNNLFASSLLPGDSSSLDAMASARDILKPHVNELMQCLDTLKSKESFDLAAKVLDELANNLRLKLGTSSGPKQNIENCQTVNMNVEENLSKKKRSHASKNC